MKYNKYLVLLVIILVIFTIFQTYSFYETSKTTVIVGYLPSDHHSALFVAESMNMYENEGINVQLVPFETGTELIKAAELGKIDVGYCGISPVTIAIDNGVPIKIVAEVNQDGSGIVVKKNGSINNVSDLNGKTIAIPGKGTVQDILLRYELSLNNISADNVNIKESEVPFMPQSLQFDKFDSFIAWEPFVSIAELQSSGKILLRSSQIWNNHPCCVVIATDKYIKKEPVELRKFLKVHKEATDYINSNRDNSAQIISGKLNTELWVEKESLNHVEFIAVPSGDYISNIHRFIQLQKQFGYVKNDISNSSLFDLSYLN